MSGFLKKRISEVYSFPRSPRMMPEQRNGPSICPPCVDGYAIIGRLTFRPNDAKIELPGVPGKGDSPRGCRGECP